MDDDNKDVLKASVAGTIERVNQLICVRPIKCRYMGEIGDVVVGRITEVQQKRWKVETNSRLDSVLLISSVNLPGGELVSCHIFLVIYRNSVGHQKIQMLFPCFNFSEGDLQKMNR